MIMINLEFQRFVKSCNGYRLNSKSLSVKIADKNIGEI